MAKYTLLVGLGKQDWDLSAVEIQGCLVRRRGKQELYRLDDGRHILYSRTDIGGSVCEVNAQGNEALGGA